MPKGLLKGGWSAKYRFVRQDASGHWNVQLHGHSFPDRFQQCQSAAAFAARKLQVPVSATLRSSPTKVSKVSQVPGINWHACKLGWVFRCGASGLSCSKAYLTEEEAAQESQGSKGSVALKGSQDKLSGVLTRSAYKHIHYHKAKKTWHYLVKVKGISVRGGGFSTPEAAAKIVAATLGVSLFALRASAKQRKANRSRVLVCFQSLLQLYCPRGSEDNLPGDLRDLSSRSSNSSSAVHSTPVVRAVLMLAKYGPWRTALEAAALPLRSELMAASEASQQALHSLQRCLVSQGSQRSQVKRTRGHDTDRMSQAKRRVKQEPDQASQVSQAASSKPQNPRQEPLSCLVPGIQRKKEFTSYIVAHCQREAIVMYKLLAGAVKNVRQDRKACRELQFWRLHVGGSVHHHHGFVPLLRNTFGILKSTSSKLGTLNVHDSSYEVMPLSNDMLLQLCLFVHLSYWMESKVSQVSQVSYPSHALLHPFEDCRFPLPKDFVLHQYHIKWWFRMLIIHRNMLGTIKGRLEHFTLADLQACVPDQQGWLRYFGAGGKKQLVKSMCKDLGYRGHPLYLTVWFCLFGDSRMQQVDPARTATMKIIIIDLCFLLLIDGGCSHCHLLGYVSQIIRSCRICLTS